MRSKIPSALMLGFVLVVSVAWIGCSGESGTVGAGSTLISPSLDGSFEVEESAPDSVWEYYSRLFEDDDTADTDDEGTQIEPIDKSGDEDSGGSKGPKDQGPRI